MSLLTSSIPVYSCGQETVAYDDTRVSCHQKESLENETCLISLSQCSWSANVDIYYRQMNLHILLLKYESFCFQKPHNAQQQIIIWVF